MKMVLLTLLLLARTFMHPFHVGVAEIAYDEEEQVIQVSQRMFSDDLEKGISRAYGISFDIIAAGEEKRDSLVLIYLNDHFHVKQQGKRLPINYLGSELAEEALWAYFEVPASSTQGLTLRNTLLFHQFDDQQNLVHITVGKDMKSYLFTPEDKEQPIFAQD
ncbi:MAG: DUF6702 family protein [Cyclobacteriaceae bacterium]